MKVHVLMILGSAVPVLPILGLTYDDTSSFRCYLMYGQVHRLIDISCLLWFIGVNFFLLYFLSGKESEAFSFEPLERSLVSALMVAHFFRPKLTIWALLITLMAERFGEIECDRN